MEETHKKFCPALWFSGFFGLGALVHLIRLLTRVSLIVGDYQVPLGVSLAVFVIASGLSAGLLFVGLKRPCCKKE